MTFINSPGNTKKVLGSSGCAKSKGCFRLAVGVESSEIPWVNRCTSLCNSGRYIQGTCWSLRNRTMRTLWIDITWRFAWHDRKWCYFTRDFTSVGDLSPAMYVVGSVLFLQDFCLWSLGCSAINCRWFPCRACDGVFLATFWCLFCTLSAVWHSFIHSFIRCWGFCASYFSWAHRGLHIFQISLENELRLKTQNHSQTPSFWHVFSCLVLFFFFSSIWASVVEFHLFLHYLRISVHFFSEFLD